MIEPEEIDRRRREETADVREALARQIDALFGGEDGSVTPLPRVTFTKSSRPSPPIFGLYDPSISIIIRGSKRVRLVGTTWVYDESRFLVTAVNLVTESEILEASPAKPYLSLLIKPDLQAARRMLADVEVHDSGAADGTSGIATGPATPELFDAISRLVTLLDNRVDLPYLGALIEREIIYRILTSSAGARFRDTVLLGTKSQKTAKAISWLRENYTQPLSVAALAKLAGMGVSTLHHHFRAMTELSPLQYQKHLRLHEARRLLIAEPIDAATAALRVGYESPTQFNREYRQMFGAPPIRDVAPLRSTGD